MQLLQTSHPVSATMKRSQILPLKILPKSDIIQSNRSIELSGSMETKPLSEQVSLGFKNELPHFTNWGKNYIQNKLANFAQTTNREKEKNSIKLQFHAEYKANKYMHLANSRSIYVNKHNKIYDTKFLRRISAALTAHKWNEQRWNKVTSSARRFLK